MMTLTDPNAVEERMAPSRVLRERVAGQSAMGEVVRAQAGARPQSSLARVFGVSPLTSQARTSYRGALGELVAGDVLENLGQRWDTLHDLPLANGSLDHLVIGPAGVFAVRTADCTSAEVIIDGDALLVAGVARDDISASRSEAEEVSNLLGAAAERPIAVSALLVLVNPRRLTVTRPASGVGVIHSSGVENLITALAPSLSGDDVAFISDLADLDATWPNSMGADVDSHQLHSDFGQIRSDVRRALFRRCIWGTATTVVVYATVCSVIATFVSIIMES